MPAGVSRKRRPPQASQTAAGLTGPERLTTRSCCALLPLLLLLARLLGDRPEVEAVVPEARLAARASLPPAAAAASMLLLVCQGSSRSWREARSEAGATGVAAAVLVLGPLEPDGGEAAPAGGGAPLGSACAAPPNSRAPLPRVGICRAGEKVGR